METKLFKNILLNRPTVLFVRILVHLLVFAVLVACSEKPGFNSGRFSLRFDPVNVSPEGRLGNQADLLIVGDVSGSMGRHWKESLPKIVSSVRELSNSGVNLRIGFIINELHKDLYDPTVDGSITDFIKASEHEEPGTLIASIFESGEEVALSDLINDVYEARNRVPGVGTEKNQAAETSLLALNKFFNPGSTLLSRFAGDSFVRKDLYILVFGDEGEAENPYSAQLLKDVKGKHYVEHFASTVYGNIVTQKGNAAHRVKVFSFTPTNSGTYENCRKGQGTQIALSRALGVEKLVKESKGRSWDICSSNKGSGFSEFVRTVRMHTKRYEFKLPVNGDIKSAIVRLDGNVINQCKNLTAPSASSSVKCWYWEPKQSSVKFSAELVDSVGNAVVDIDLGAKKPI